MGGLIKWVSENWENKGQNQNWLAEGVQNLVVCKMGGGLLWMWVYQLHTAIAATLLLPMWQRIALPPQFSHLADLPPECKFLQAEWCRIWVNEVFPFSKFSVIILWFQGIKKAKTKMKKPSRFFTPRWNSLAFIPPVRKSFMKTTFHPVSLVYRITGVSLHCNLKQQWGLISK